MDLNLVVLAGRLAATPEVRRFDNGSSLARYLVTTRSERPRRRIDVVPVVLWDADANDADLRRGDRVWVAGAVQRRFWSDDRNRRSRLEVVAFHVQRHLDPDGFASDQPPAMVEGSAEV
ncbi:MAG: single-stranded DNA-binding protein [Acidimicrobiia bacterium]